MHRFWTGVVEPLLRGLKPKTIVEIGADRGDNTRLLAGFCQQQGAVLHAIDPQPGFDVTAWQNEYAGTLVFHQSLSLEALPRIGAMEAVLIDGDHNWYTVFNELKTIDRLSGQLGRPLPLVFLHDTGWPYGRRDLYYDPGRIPETYRKPYHRAGMRLNVSELQEEGGLNPHMNNAVYEGGAQNGVLTAIEDYLAATTQCVQFSQVPGFHGLGILAGRALIANQAALAACVKKIDEESGEARRLRGLETKRLGLAIQVQELERKVNPKRRWQVAALAMLAAKLRRKLIARETSQALQRWPVAERRPQLIRL